MQSIFERYILLAKRWWWLPFLGIVLCGGTTYVLSKMARPVYQASASLLISFETSPSSNDNIAASLASIQTYTALTQNPTILSPIAAEHHMTLAQLTSMLTVAPKQNTAVIEVDVDNNDPTLAMQLANEVSAGFATYAVNNLTVTVRVFPAYRPVVPVRPHAVQNAGLGALVGLGLSLALIFLFEWFDDRLKDTEEVQNLLSMEMLAAVPQLARSGRLKNLDKAPALTEACLMLCATLDSAQKFKSFKTVMVTSALSGEGKSTIAASLASLLAMTQKRVLLIDADLRRPVLHKHFQIDNSSGLIDLLEENRVNDLELESQPTAIRTLHVLTAGQPQADSANLLQSSKAIGFFNYLKNAPYDYVIFDTPPLLAVADGQFLAAHIHAAVLVVDSSKTPRKVLLRAKRVLGRTRMLLLGVVVNKSQWPEYGYVRQYQSDVRRVSSNTLKKLPEDSPAQEDDAEYLLAVNPPLEEQAEPAIPNTPPVEMDGTFAFSAPTSLATSSALDQEYSDSASPRVENLDNTIRLNRPLKKPEEE